MNIRSAFCCLLLMVLSSGAFASANTLLPDVKALALDKLVLDRTNQPVTVIETPPIMTSKGEVAKGMTEIILSLDASAKNSLIIQGKTLAPGSTLSVVIDLTATSGAIKIPAYPAKSGINSLDEYKIDVPKVTAQLCSDEYTYDQAKNVCLKVITTNLLYSCPDLSWKATGDLRNCTQETTIAKESCPVGYDSNGNGTCTKTEFQSTVPKCESGYSYSTTAKHCEKTLTESAYKTCSDPTYTYNSGTNDCRKTISQSVNYDCAAGYNYNSSIKKCERTLTATASKVCSTGFTYSSTNNRCEKPTSINATPVCSSGHSYNSSTQRCEQTLTAGANKVCSVGFSYSSTNNRCEKTTTVMPTKVCSSGWTFSSVNNRCEKTETVPAYPVCSSGYSYNSTTNRCEKTETVNAAKVCGAGYAYISARDRCEKTTTVNADIVCSSGYTYSSFNNRCEKTETVNASKVCASGYTFKNDRCEKITTVTADKVCSSGYTYSSANDRCEKTTTVAANKVCASGYTFSTTNNRCEKMTVVNAALECPPGAQLGSNGKCYEAEKKWMCSNTAMPVFDAKWGACMGGAPNGYGINTTYCVQTGPTTSKCSTGLWNVTGSQNAPQYSMDGFINSLVEVPSVSTCPSGYSLSGSTCSNLEAQAFSYSCNSGNILSGSSCTQLLTANYSYSCPAGFTQSGSTCSKLETAGYSYSCSAGYTLSGSSCSRLLTQSNTYSCTVGFTQSGSTCSKLEVAGYSYSCGAGYTLSGSSCSKLLTQSNSYSCDAGYTLSGSSCSRLLTQPYSNVCGADFTLSGSTCSKFETQAFVYQCGDPTYTLSGSICSKLTFVPNTWSCPANTNLSGDACLGTDTLPFTYSCPANYTNHNNGSCSLYQSQGYTLSCTDKTYTSNQSAEICEKVLTASHIYKCNDSKYTLNGSSCSLLLTATEEWVCGDLSYTKISEAQCRRFTDADLVGKCPTNYVRSGNICTMTSKVPQLERCGQTFSRNGAECERDVFKAAICDDGLLSKDSCTCPAGTTLNINSWMCEGVEKSAVIKSCPASYSLVNGQCEYQHEVGVVYDYCAIGMTSSGKNCLLNIYIPSTQSCNSPYSIISGQCQYTDILPAGVGGGDIEAKSYEGRFVSETSSTTLESLEFDAVVSEVNEIAVDVDGGCRLVTTEAEAKGIIKKGDIPCAVIWKDLPGGITGKDNKLTGIFTSAGQQTIGYQLKAFNGTSGTPFIVSEGEIIVDVTMPAKPKVTDITTRMMNKVVRGFDVYNYDATSKVNLTTALVEPKSYEQVVEIEGVGSCTVPANAPSCNIYSDESFERDEENLKFTSTYKIWGNSKIGGWNKADLTPINWNINHDFRGPKVAFTEWNGDKSNSPIVNEDLGFPVIVNGGEGAVGIVNFRDEVALEDRWWRPTKVDLEFVSDDGKKSVSMINVNGINVSFDVPQSKDGSISLSNYKLLEHVNANAYPFMMSSLTPGIYNVKVTAKDAFNNLSVTNIAKVKVATPAPQIKIFNKKSMVSGSSSPSVVMLDDFMVVAHNGFEGDTKITSVKIDDRQAISSNTDDHYKLLTGEGFDLAANKPYSLIVEAQSSNGVVTQSTVNFNYLQMEFNFQRKPKTVIQLVEDVGLIVSRTKGLRCDIYGTKTAAALAANDINHACYVEWSKLPDGMSTESSIFQAAAKGGVSNLGLNTAEFTAYVVNKFGKSGVVSKDSVTFESMAPSPITLKLDERLKLAEDVYSISVLDRQIGRYQGTSSRANIDIDLSTNDGESKQYKHNQLPFGEIQNFSAYAEKLGQAKLWDKVPYTLKGSYRLAPEISNTVKFDLVVTPHPYMQVLMDLDDTRYASTEKINATISLGIKNNLTNTFDYSIETMGTRWDVYLAFKKGKDYEPISDAIQIGTNGKGVIQIDADIIFNRNEAVYAVAEARSPYPEVEITRVSIPRSITVVKGTAVDGEIVSRVVHSRIPAAFDLRFDTESFQDFMVMGEIKWQRDVSGSWVDMTELSGRQYVSVKSVEPETIDVRAVITNKETGAVTETETLRLISFDKPKMRIDGVTQAISGQTLELTAVDVSGGVVSDAVYEWSMDGDTWEKGFGTYNVNVENSSIRVYGRMKYANTSDEIQMGQWATAVKYISVTKPKPITLSVVRPSMAEVDTEITLKMLVSNPFASTGVDLFTEWVLPDGTVIKDQKEITYTLQESDLDGSKRVTFVARSWLDGFKDVTLGQANAVMNTFSYSFPSESDLSLTVNNNVKFVPSSGFANVNMPYINAPGVVFTYDWTFDDTVIKKVSSNGKGMNFNVIQAGVHEIMVTVSDNRGNFAQIKNYVEAQEPNDLTFVLNEVYSNKFMRAPLTASIYPNVKVGHPYDFVKEYTWTVNGVKSEPSSRAVGAFNELVEGHYDIILDVKTNFGQVGQTTFSVDVVANKIPTCAPSVRSQYGTYIVDANCKDEDGRITFYKWVVNGMVFSPYGPQVRFTEHDYPNGATIAIEANDDAGGKGVGHTSF